LWSLLVSRMPRVLVHLLVTTSDVAVASLTVEHPLTRPLQRGFLPYHKDSFMI
jgi:hypothetical protein